MISRIITVLFVLVVVFLFVVFSKQIKAVLGAALVSAIVGGLFGMFCKWIACGEFLCWSAFKTGAIVGMIIAGVIVVLGWIISIAR